MSFDDDDDDDDHENLEAIGENRWQIISTKLHELIAHKRKIGKSKQYSPDDGALFCDVDPKELFGSSSWNYIKRRPTDLSSCNIQIPYRGKIRICIHGDNVSSTNVLLSLSR